MQLEPTVFSQGPGNFRDVNQNRRNDVLINPAVGDFDVRMFLSFVQADGYNPLTVATTNFRVPHEQVQGLISELRLVGPARAQAELRGSPNASGTGTGAGAGAGDLEAIKRLLTKPFRPGQLFRDMKSMGLVSSLGNEEFLNKVVASADQAFAAAYMQNGYWSDVSPPLPRILPRSDDASNIIM